MPGCPCPWPGEGAAGSCHLKVVGKHCLKNHPARGETQENPALVFQWGTKLGGFCSEPYLHTPHAAPPPAPGNLSCICLGWPGYHSPLACLGTAPLCLGSTREIFQSCSWERSLVSAGGKGLALLMVLPRLFLPTDGLLRLGNPPWELPCPTCTLPCVWKYLGDTGQLCGALAAGRCSLGRILLQPEDAFPAQCRRYRRVWRGGRLPPPPLLKRITAVNTQSSSSSSWGSGLWVPWAGTTVSAGQRVRAGCFPSSRYSLPEEADATSVFARRLLSCS